MSYIKENLQEISKTLKQGVKLIAVSKFQPVEKLTEAYQAGQRSFGENRVQELCQKQKDLPKDIEWHFIGHLQKNKVKYIIPFVSLIHSVDSPDLLKEIDKQAGKAGRIIPCLLQLHIAQEKSKFGFTPEECRKYLESQTWKKFQNIRIDGVMGMASFTKDQTQIHLEFHRLKTFFEETKKTFFPTEKHFREISIGMSGDYKIAMEEGSTMVRVGTAIFGNRSFTK